MASQHMKDYPNNIESMDHLKSLALSTNEDLKRLHSKHLFNNFNSNEFEILLEELENGRYDETKMKIRKRVEWHILNSLQQETMGDSSKAIENKLEPPNLYESNKSVPKALAENDMFHKKNEVNIKQNLSENSHQLHKPEFDSERITLHTPSKTTRRVKFEDNVQDHKELLYSKRHKKQKSSKIKKKQHNMQVVVNPSINILPLKKCSQNSVNIFPQASYTNFPDNEEDELEISFSPKKSNSPTIYICPLSQENQSVSSVPYRKQRKSDTSLSDKERNRYLDTRNFLQHERQASVNVTPIEMDIPEVDNQKVYVFKHPNLEDYDSEQREDKFSFNFDKAPNSDTSSTENSSIIDLEIQGFNAKRFLDRLEERLSEVLDPFPIPEFYNCQEDVDLNSNKIQDEEAMRKDFTETGSNIIANSDVKQNGCEEFLSNLLKSRNRDFIENDYQQSHEFQITGCNLIESEISKEKVGLSTKKNPNSILEPSQIEHFTGANNSLTSIPDKAVDNYSQEFDDDIHTDLQSSLNNVSGKNASEALSCEEVHSSNSFISDSVSQSVSVNSNASIVTTSKSKLNVDSSLVSNDFEKYRLDDSDNRSSDTISNSKGTLEHSCDSNDFKNGLSENDIGNSEKSATDSDVRDSNKPYNKIENIDKRNTINTSVEIEKSLEEENIPYKVQENTEIMYQDHKKIKGDTYSDCRVEFREVQDMRNIDKEVDMLESFNEIGDECKKQNIHRSVNESVEYNEVSDSTKNNKENSIPPQSAPFSLSPNSDEKEILKPKSMTSFSRPTSIGSFSNHDNNGSVNSKSDEISEISEPCSPLKTTLTSENEPVSEENRTVSSSKLATGNLEENEISAFGLSSRGIDYSVNSSNYTPINASGSISPGETVLPLIEISDLTISEGEIEFEASITDIEPCKNIAIKFSTKDLLNRVTPENTTMSDTPSSKHFDNKETQTSQTESCITRDSSFSEGLVQRVSENGVLEEAQENESSNSGNCFSEGEVPQNALDSISFNPERETLMKQNEILRKKLSSFTGRFCIENEKC